jgi:hypothetical protein
VFWIKQPFRVVDAANIWLKTVGVGAETLCVDVAPTGVFTTGKLLVGLTSTQLFAPPAPTFLVQMDVTPCP